MNFAPEIAGNQTLADQISNRHHIQYTTVVSKNNWRQFEKNLTSTARYMPFRISAEALNFLCCKEKHAKKYQAVINQFCTALEKLCTITEKKYEQQQQKIAQTNHTDQ